MIETWQDIPGYSGYKASDQRRIGSCYKHTWGKYAIGNRIVRVLKPHLHNGYAIVHLHKDGRPHTMKIARLVMLAFCGPKPRGLDVCHCNNIRDDDRLCNLRYDTRSANLQESMLVGKHLRKLTLEQARTARVEYAEGNVSQETLARRRGVSRGAIRGILRGDTYTDAGGPILGEA